MAPSTIGDLRNGVQRPHAQCYWRYLGRASWQMLQSGAPPLRGGVGLVAGVAGRNGGLYDGWE